MTPPQMTKTRSTLLTVEETHRAAAGIKLLAASKGYVRYTDLHMALVGAGYPGSYATFTRLLSSSRAAQASEVDTIARFFGVHRRDLTGREVNPIKDPVPPRLIEFDLPAPEAPEGPKPLPLPRIRPAKAAPAALPADALLALAEAIAELTAAVRESTGTAPRLRDVG